MRQHSPHHPITAATPPNPAPPVTRPPVKHPAGDWQALLAGSLTTGDQLARHLPSADRDTSNRVAVLYPMRINPCYLALVLPHGGPLLRQAVPSGQEMDDRGEVEDPLQEEKHDGGKLPRGALHLPP